MNFTFSWEDAGTEALHTNTYGKEATAQCVAGNVAYFMRDITGSNLSWITDHSA